MTVPIWVAELAGDFWSKAKESEPFPRQLLRPIARAVKLHVAFSPEMLTIASMLRQFRSLGIVCEMRVPDRALKACLIARHGHGIALIDGTDADNERRFSIAHELAHFLRDYIDRRDRVRRRIGHSAHEVLDGLRLPNADERLSALLSGSSIDFHVHLMDRDHGRTHLSSVISDAEESADRLAYELLAPADHVSARIQAPDQLVARLVHYYGLPHQQAIHYAGLLLPRPEPIDPFLARLGFDRQAAELPVDGRNNSQG